MVIIDNIDMSILELLSRDGRSSATDISKDLAEKGLLLTSRSVLNRRKRLEKYKIIQGYTTRLNPALFAGKESIIILLKFVDSRDSAEIRKLSSYLCGSSFCFFATEMVGEAEGYDFACHLVFDTEQKLDLQLKLILNTFGNLVAHYKVYKSKIIKEPCVISCTHNSYGVKTLKPLDKQTPDELDYIQSFLSQCMDDIARRLLARAGYL